VSGRPLDSTSEPPRIVERPGAPDRDVLRERGRELGIHPLLVRLMYTRGVANAIEQRELFEARLGGLRQPDAMAGFTAALDLLERAIESGIRVGVFGDYDVDGVTTAAILTTYLEALGLEVVSRVAHREQGYGFTVMDADAFVDAGVELVITGDVGTSDIDAIRRLREHGVRSIVIDHHQVPKVSPPADAFINPHQSSCAFAFKGLCSAGVAFYLCAGLRSRLKAKAQARLPPDPREWLDLVAVATICDMMPLRAENRALVRAGLRRLSDRARPGFASLLAAAGVESDVNIDEEVVGFKLGPRLNAPGRMGAAEPALRLLRSRTATEAEPLAEQIEMLNARRRHHTEEATSQALVLLQGDAELAARAGLVVASEAWLPGIVGIVAARLAERYGRPAVVLAIDPAEALARGSVRGVPGVDVRAALEACGSIIDRFGGHREAAGLTLRSTRIGELALAFAAAIAAQPRSVDGEFDREVVDCALPLRVVDMQMCETLDALGPYGIEFEAPRFWAEGLRVETVRVLKERHLLLTLSQAQARREAIAFDQAHHGLAIGDEVGCIFVPRLERFRGESRVRLQIDRLWRSRAKC